MDSNLETHSLQQLRELYNTPDEQSAVKAICRKLLTSLNLQQVPLPLRPICNRLKLQVNYTNAESLEDSILKLAPQGFTIDISKRKNWRRNRFTIAHEIIHLLLYNTVGIPLQSYDRHQYELIERLCDVGASELLVSEDKLQLLLQEFGLNTEGMKKLYDGFLVSYEALFLKLAEFLSANIIIWKSYARHGGDNREFRVYNHFPKYRYADKSTWLPTGCTAKHVAPNVLLENEWRDSTLLLADFQVLMNKKVTPCHAICFAFPTSRSSTHNLPMFEELVVKDESIYDDCVVMLLFSQKENFANAAKFIKP